MVELQNTAKNFFDFFQKGVKSCSRYADKTVEVSNWLQVVPVAFTDECPKI